DKLVTGVQTCALPIFYPSAGERFAILEESVAVVAGLFGEGPVDHEGDRFRLRSAYNRPRPVSRSDGSTGPPIWLGGKGGDRLLRSEERRVGEGGGAGG